MVQFANFERYEIFLLTSLAKLEAPAGDRDAYPQRYLVIIIHNDLVTLSFFFTFFGRFDQLH
jgi:hypothetical protein